MAIHWQTTPAIRANGSYRPRRAGYHIAWCVGRHISCEATCAQGSIQPDTTHERSRVAFHCGTLIIDTCLRAFLTPPQRIS